MSVALKPQDVLVVLKLVAHPRKDWSYPKLAAELAMSASKSMRPSVEQSDRGSFKTARGQRRIEERSPSSSCTGIKYAFPAERGSLTRGVPTAHAASPLREQVLASDEPPPVWPDPDGSVRGGGLDPLYRSVSKAARANPALYELLALVDAESVRAARASASSP